MKRSLCVLTLLLGAARLEAATIKVCASGCDYTNSQAQIQAALDAALPGDTILLQENVTYADVILPNQKSCPAQDATCYITLRTGVNSTGAVQATTNYPVANHRVVPAAVASVFAKFQTTANNVPGIRTTYPGEIRTNCATQPCITAFWKLQWLELLPNSYAGGPLLILGNNDLASNLPNNNPQDTLAEVPHDFQVVACYLHGHAIKGSTRGIELHAKTVTIQDSYLADFKEVGREAQGITYLNGPGVLTLTNNYVEGSTENFIAGGGDPMIRQSQTVTVPTSATQATLSAVTDLSVGQGVTFLVASVVTRATIQSIAGNVVTFTSLGGVPDSPGAVKWSVVPKTLSVTKNWFYKPPAWRQPIVGTPQNVQPQTTTTGGTLAAGTYTYRVVAKLTTAEGVIARSTPSLESAIATTGAASTITISWATVAGAEYYEVYGRNAGAETYRLYTTGTSVTDTGAASSGTCPNDTTTPCTESVPTTTGTVWFAKNVFELKNWDTATIQGNVFDYSWQQGQTGFLVLFTTVNQEGNANSNMVANVTFRDNKARHGASGVQITTTGSAQGPAQIAHDLSILNNSFEDVGSQWTDTPISLVTATVLSGLNPTGAPLANFTWDHNTAIQADGAEFFAVNTFSGQQYTNSNLTWKNSMQRRLLYGLRAYDGNGLMGEGNTSWTAVTTGAPVFTKNVIADGPCSLYPSSSTNFCPDSAAWQAEFVDYAGGNYRLKTTSAYHNAGTDGKDLGADYDVIETLTNIALSGDNAGVAGQLSQPSITTTTPLPQLPLGVAYTTSFAATSGTGPYAWSCIGCALPTGLAFSGAGVLSGTPTAAGTYTFTVKVTDSQSQIATKTVSQNVIQLSYPEPRPDKLFYNEGIFFRRSICPDGTVDQIKVGDLCYDLTASALKVATATSPAVVWTAVFSTSTFTNGGNSFGALTKIGTSDAQTLQFLTNNANRLAISSVGDTTFLTDQNDNLAMVLSNNQSPDLFTHGFNTANGSKGYFYTNNGTYRGAFGISKPNASTDYAWGFTGSTDGGVTFKPVLRGRVDGWLATVNPLISITAPTVSSGFAAAGSPATPPVIEFHNGTATFVVQTGNGTAASSGVIGLPTAPTGWNCTVNNITAAAAHRADNTRQTASSTTTATVENQTTSSGAAANWTALDRLRVSCLAY